MPSPYVSNSCGFSRNSEGGGGLKAQGVACRYGIAVGLLTVRPCRYGKETRAGRQGKHGRGVPVRDSCRAPHCAPRPVRQGKKSGPGRRAAGQVGTGETVALCTYVTTS
jgi:hypothetical protein